MEKTLGCRGHGKTMFPGLLKDVKKLLAIRTGKEPFEHCLKKTLPTRFKVRKGRRNIFLSAKSQSV